MGKSITDLSSVTTVGLDLAKHVFQIHCVDGSGRVVTAKAIRRKHLLEFFASLPPCLVGDALPCLRYGLLNRSRQHVPCPFRTVAGTRPALHRSVPPPHVG